MIKSQQRRLSGAYQRNTVDVEDAVAQLQQIQQQRTQLPIKAVIMVPTYRAAAKFIERTRDRYPDMIYTSVSFVGSTALANELMLLWKSTLPGSSSRRSYRR